MILTNCRIYFYVLCISCFHKVLHSNSVAVLDGFVYDEKSKFLFKMEEQKMNKTSAQGHCVDQGAVLVMIDSYTKQSVLQDYLGEINQPWKEHYYFINAEKTNNIWTFSNGNTIPMTYFDPLVASDQSKCAVLDSEVPGTPFLWTAMDCAIEESFICQYYPECQANPAPIFPNIYRMIYTGNAIGKQSIYGCSGGLHPIGSNTSTCLVNRTWSRPEMDCAAEIKGTASRLINPVKIASNLTTTSTNVPTSTISGDKSTEPSLYFTERTTITANVNINNDMFTTIQSTSQPDVHVSATIDLDTSESVSDGPVSTGKGKMKTNGDVMTTAPTSNSHGDLSTQSDRSTVKTYQRCKEIYYSNGYTCFCINKSSYNMTGLAERIQQLKDILLLDKTQTTKIKRRKYSARDDRISSISLGLVFGAGVLIISACAIAMSDAAAIYKAVHRGPWYARHKRFALH